MLTPLIVGGILHSIATLETLHVIAAVSFLVLYAAVVDVAVELLFSVRAKLSHIVDVAVELLFSVRAKLSHIAQMICMIYSQFMI